MKIRWILAGLLCYFSGFSCLAQLPIPYFPTDALLDPVDYEPFTQFYNNQYLFNPAFAGDESQPVASLLTRTVTQSRESKIWSLMPPLGAALNQLELADRPRLYHFNLNSYEPSWKSSWGFQFTYYEPTNPNAKRVVDAGLSFNYEVPMGEVWKLKFGITASLLHYDEDFLFDVDGNPYIGGPNQYIPVKLNERKLKSNTDIGVLMKGPKLYFGAAINNMNEPSFQFYESPGGRVNRFRRKIFVTAGSDFDLGGVVKFKPAIFFSQYMNSTYTTLIFDANVMAEIKEKLSLGATVRFNERRYGGALALGYKFSEKYQLMFSYDLPKSDVSSYTYSRFEVGLYLHLPRVWDEEEQLDLE